MRNDRSLDKYNAALSNVYMRQGDLFGLSDYFSPEKGLSNFVISGGAGTKDRFAPVYPFLAAIAGHGPIVVIHKNNPFIESIASKAMESNNSSSPQRPLWICNRRNSIFEPFLSMNEMQIVSACREIAKKLNYTTTARFEVVVKAHLEILKLINSPYSLSGLYYLCNFSDINELYNNIMELGCDEATKRRIWANLDIDNNGGEQFYLFRSVINNLAKDAERCGWNPDNGVSSCNCLTAAKGCALFTLPVDDSYSETVLTYLAEELKIIGDVPIFLVIEGIKITDESFVKVLLSDSYNRHFGIISENIVDQINNKENFKSFAEKVNYYVLFKHGTGGTAEALSELIGKFDCTKQESTTGTNRRRFSLWADDTHKDVRYSTENRYRVMPEVITGLLPGQAIVFCTYTDEIIFYN